MSSDEEQLLPPFMDPDRLKSRPDRGRLRATIRCLPRLPPEDGGGGLAPFGSSSREKLRPLLNPKGGAVKWVEGGGEVDPGRLPPLELNPLQTFLRRTWFLIFVHQSRGRGARGARGPSIFGITSTSAFLTNAQSRFAIVVLDGVSMFWDLLT